MKSLKWSLLSFVMCIYSMFSCCQCSKQRYPQTFHLQTDSSLRCCSQAQLMQRYRKASGWVWGARAAVLTMARNDYSEKYLISKTLSKHLLSRCSYQTWSAANANSALSLCTVVTHSVYIQVISHISALEQRCWFSEGMVPWSGLISPTVLELIMGKKDKTY